MTQSIFDDTEVKKAVSKPNNDSIFNDKEVQQSVISDVGTPKKEGFKLDPVSFIKDFAGGVGEGAWGTAVDFTRSMLDPTYENNLMNKMYVQPFQHKKPLTMEDVEHQYAQGREDLKKSFTTAKGWGNMVGSSAVLGGITGGVAKGMPKVEVPKVFEKTGDTLKKLPEEVVDTELTNPIVNDAEGLAKELILQNTEKIPVTIEEYANIPDEYKSEYEPVNEAPSKEAFEGEVHYIDKEITKEEYEAQKAQDFMEWATKTQEEMQAEPERTYKHINNEPIGLSPHDDIKTIRSKIVADTDISNLKALEVADKIEELLPNKADREAVAKMFRYGNLDEFAHNTMKKDIENPLFKDHVEAIKKSMNPTSEMKEAQKLLEGYFKEQAEVGQVRGVLDRLRDNYLPQKWDIKKAPSGLTPKDWLKVKANAAKERVYKNWREGIINGEKSATEDIVDLLKLSSHDFSVGLTNRKLIPELERLGGRWTDVKAKEPYETQFMGMEKITPILDNGDRVRRISGGGILQLKQIFVIPNEVAEAIEPLMSKHIQPNPVYNAIRKVNGVLKANLLGGIGAGYHFYNITKNMISANLSVGDFFKYGFDKDVQVAYAKYGGKLTTADIGLDVMMEISRDKRPLVRVASIMFNNPITKGLNEALFKKYIPAAQTALWKKNMTHWALKHPDATLGEIETAARSLAEHSNNMGGFSNLKAKGIPAKYRDVGQQLMLALQWNAAKVYHLMQLFEDTAGGHQARMTMLRGIAYSQIFGNLINTLLTGHPMYDNPDGHKFDIMWGKNSNVYTGTLTPANEDVVKLADKTFGEKGKGIIGGPVAFAEGKGSPVVRLSKSFSEVAQNKNYFGKDIYDKEATPLEKTGESIEYIAAQNADVPIGFQNWDKLNKKGDTNPVDYVLSGVGIGTVGSNPENAKKEKRIRNKRKRLEKKKHKHKSSNSELY